MCHAHLLPRVVLASMVVTGNLFIRAQQLNSFCSLRVLFGPRWWLNTHDMMVKQNRSKSNWAACLLGILYALGPTTKLCIDCSGMGLASLSR